MDTRMADSMSKQPSYTPPVMDYEGSGYRTDFWEGQSRQYEDAVERLVLQDMLPRPTHIPASSAPVGPRRIAEIGAGFGRLADMYLDYDQIILFDYSRTLLQDAVERWGDDPRFVFVAGNVYDLPLATGVLDTLVMVRVMHHLLDVPRALSQLRRVLHQDSVAVVEYANKRNLKAYLRWVLGRQSWSPLDLAPVEFVKLNFDFHPAWMQRRFEQARFRVDEQAAVSHFRLPLLKRLVAAERLAALDARLFSIGGRFPLSPSVFVRLLPIETADAVPQVITSTLSAAQAGAKDQSREGIHGDISGMPQPDGARGVVDLGAADLEAVEILFCCPGCFSDGSLTRPETDRLVCRVCGAAYGRHAGIWDFKERL